MARIIYGGQLANLCLLSKDLLDFEPLIGNAGYAPELVLGKSDSWSSVTDHDQQHVYRFSRRSRNNRLYNIAIT